MGIPEEKQVKLVAYRLKGGASAWWEQLQTSRGQQCKAPIRSWPRMKKLLRGRYLPANYDQILFQLYHNCKQGNCPVRVYAEEFSRLSIRNNLAETATQQVARFNNGLRLNIQDRVMLQTTYSLNAAIDLATRVETQLERSSFRNQTPGRPAPPQYTDWGRPPVHANTQAPIVSQPAVNPLTANRDFASSSNQGRQGAGGSNTKGPIANPYTRPTPEKCYRCGKPGRRSNQCPNRATTNLATHVEYTEPKYSNTGEGFDGEDNDAGYQFEDIVGADDGLSLVVQRLLYAPKQEIDSQRHNIFRTKCTVNQRVCDLIIDSGSTENIVSKEMVEKLKLSKEQHPMPYKIG